MNSLLPDDYNTNKNKTDTLIKQSKSDEEAEEEEDSSSASPSTTTAMASTPETPVFPRKDGEDATENNEEQEQQEVLQVPMMMPSLLLNGPQYEQSLDKSQQQNHHNHSQQQRPSFLQEPFPPEDEQDDDPLTLEEYSDHSSADPLLSPQLQDQEPQTPQQAEQQHPLLRHRKNTNANALLSSQKHSPDRPRFIQQLSLPRKQMKKAIDTTQQQGPEQEDDSFLFSDSDFPTTTTTATTTNNPSLANSSSSLTASLMFEPKYAVTYYLHIVSATLMRSPHQYDPMASATWIGFWALFLVTCSNYVLMPMRDAIALAVGVEYIPKLTLASTVLAVFSSVPIGWLFEAPDPQRRKLWKQIGFTRGETQGSSLALFYRFFALWLWCYAIGFKGVELVFGNAAAAETILEEQQQSVWWMGWIKIGLGSLGQGMYIAFFLVVHLMKLHSLSLVWGVTTEAMEYEETARKRLFAKLGKDPPSSKMRLQRLAFIGFGGTVGGILGSAIASSLAHIFKLSGLLVVSALMLEAAAQLAIELGRIMQKHWMQQQLFPSTDNLASLDASMKRSASLGSMKRISSGNSLNRVKSMSEMQMQRSNNASSSKNSLASLEKEQEELQKQQQVVDDTFSQRLLRGITTILQSRLLMAIFTYNALYASTTVLLSFQRAELVANRKADTTTEGDTAFLANINMASSVAVFALQSSGIGAFVAHRCGTRGTLALMPLIRVMGVMALAYWHHASNGAPPNLLLFLALDECCRVMNMAVAKPVRESLWRGLSNEARYEAKPIVDTLANRWGGGSAAFLVSSINKLLDLFGIPQPDNGDIRVVFGFPPVLFLCMIVATWWAAVSADLGQIRRRIDSELKKMQ